jgi:hypothetical protein
MVAAVGFWYLAEGLLLVESLWSSWTVVVCGGGVVQRQRWMSSGTADGAEEAPVWMSFHPGTTGISSADIVVLNIQGELMLSFGAKFPREGGNV